MTTGKRALMIVGIVIVLIGLGWAGQGAGIINWPKSSFMVDSRPWITRGLLFACLGAVLIVVARQTRRP